MLYRRPVNKLMRHASLPSLHPAALVDRHSGPDLMSRPGIYALKSLILIHPPLLDLHNSGSRNEPTIVSSRSPAAVDDTLRREKRVVDLGGRGGWGGARGME